jgi:hypothetical protein
MSTGPNCWRLGVASLARTETADIRVKNVLVDDDNLTVELMDGRVISTPLAWYPRLLKGDAGARSRWEISAGGYGIHWPDLDEDLSTEGLLRGTPAR